jgi:hypothetical protein
MGGYEAADQIESLMLERALRIGRWELGLPVAYRQRRNPGCCRNNLNPAVVEVEVCSKNIGHWNFLIREGQG